MTIPTHSATFLAYAISSTVLCANLLLLWAYSGLVRNRLRSTPNAEDAALFGSSLSDADPPAIARVLRAHANAQANTLPFLVLGLIYLLAAGPSTPAIAYFAAFCLARVAHGVAYIAGRQPWRTLAYTAGALATLALMAHTAWLLGAAA